MDESNDNDITLSVMITKCWREIPLKLPVWMCVCLVVYQAGLEPSFFTRVIISGAGNPGLRDFRHCSSPCRGWGTWHGHCSWVLTSCHSAVLRTFFGGDFNCRVGHKAWFSEGYGYVVVFGDLFKLYSLTFMLPELCGYGWKSCVLIFCKIYPLTYMIHVCV